MIVLPLVINALMNGYSGPATIRVSNEDLQLQFVKQISYTFRGCVGEHHLLRHIVMGIPVAG